MSHRSVSQLGTYSRCSWQYKLERVDRVPQRPAAWTAQGTAVHAAIEYWELSRRTAHVKQAQEVFHLKWNEELTRFAEREPDLGRWMRGGNISPEKDIANRYKAGMEQVARYIEEALASEFHVMALPDGSPAVEVPFDYYLDDVEVYGFIDLILEDASGRVLVQDAKTGKRPGNDIQLYTYRYAIQDTLGVDTQWGRYWLGKTGATDPIDLTKVSRDLLTEWYVAMDRGEKLGSYIPNPGDGCFPCGVKDYCLARVA